jgi:hypothetical protein
LRASNVQVLLKSIDIIRQHVYKKRTSSVTVYKTCN